MKRFTSQLVVAGLIVLITASISLGQGRFPQTISITQGFVDAITHLPNWGAEKYASQFGLNLKTILFSNVPDEITALIRGDFDIMDATPSTVIGARDQGVPLVMIGGDSRRSTGMVVSTKLNVPEGDWKRMREVVAQAANSGKKLRLAAAIAVSANYVECYYELKQNGIDPSKDIERVNIPSFAEHPGALQRGDVDMTCSPEPQVTQAVNSGAGKRFAVPYSTPARDLLGAVVVSQASLNNPEKREAFKRYMQAMEYVIKRLRDDPEERVQLAMKVLKVNDRKYAEQALANSAWDVKFDFKEVQALAKMHYELGQTKKDWSKDIESIVTEEFIKDLK